MNKTEEDKHSFIFIRHGQSVHNIIAEQLSKKLGPDFKKSQEYQDLKYSADIIDGDVTAKGQQQALSAKQKIKKELENDQIDTVIVSPLRRALLTCDIIFGDRKDIKVFVEPLMSQILSSSVDIGGRIKESYAIYGEKYDFSKFKPQEINEQSWYLNLLEDQNKRKLVQEEKQKNNVPLHIATLQTMKKAPVETFKQLRERAEKLKKALSQYVKNKKNPNKKICLVGHTALFKSITSTQFKQSGEPIDGKDLQNCVPEEIQVNLSH